MNWGIEAPPTRQNDNEYTMEQKLENWVAFPRKITSDFREGKITHAEMDVYNWLRLNANPYGIATTSFSDLVQDLFRGKNSENNINKILLSLKRKRYIYYKKRTGGRGSFEVHFDDFITPSKQITTLDRFFEPEEVRTSDKGTGAKRSGPQQSLGSESQNFKKIKDDIKSIVYGHSTSSEIRGSNNDTDNKKEKDINTGENSSLKGDKPKPPYYDMATKRIIEE